MRKVVIALSLFIAGWTYATEETLLEARYGISDVTSILGNGRLTLGVTATGRVGLCRWPSPSHFDQLSYHVPPGQDDVETAPIDHGLQWGVEIDGRVVWCTDKAWTLARPSVTDSLVSITKATFSGPGAQQVTQSIIVDPEWDSFVVHFTYQNFSASPTLYWFANFTPCTRKLPELPIADTGTMDRLNDFAAFSQQSPNRVVHFRPTAPGASEWARAEDLLNRPIASKDWKDFPEGSWIAYSSPDTVVAQRIASTRYPGEGLRNALEKGDVSYTSAIGDTASLIALRPAPGPFSEYSTTIHVAFGEDYSAVERTLTEAESSDYESLRQRFLDREKQRLTRSIFQMPQNGHLSALVGRCILVMLTAQDAATGAIVRSPVTQPALARDWARHGAWINYALRLSEYREEAKRHTEFYSTLIRPIAERSKPIGSMPSSVYADGEAASPHLVIDTEATAAYLWDSFEHTKQLGRADRDRFYASHWPAISRAATFLAGWFDARTGRPLHSFNHTLGHDAQTHGQYMLVRRGLASALAMAEMADAKVDPSWERQKRVVDILYQTLLLDESTDWGGAVPLPLSWATSPDPQVQEHFDRRVRLRLETLDSENPIDALRLLAQAAALWENDAVRLRQLSPHLLPSLRSLFEYREGNQRHYRGTDALAAAYAVIAVMIVEGE